MKLVIAAFCISCAWGQLDRPSLGTMVDSSGAARPIIGLPGTISVGDPVATGVLSSACSKQLCVLKTATSILIQGASIAAPPGPALFAFSNQGVYAFFPQSKQLVLLLNGQLTPVDFDIAGEILSIRAVSGAVEFAVRRQGGISIVRTGNAVVDALPPDAGSVLLLDQSVVFTTRDAVVLLRPDASSVRFPLPHATSLAQLSPSYVQIRTRGLLYALRVDPGREQLFLLPEPVQ